MPCFDHCDVRSERRLIQISLPSHGLSQASIEEDVEDESAGANYQLDMMRCLREVNVDYNTVGW